ncbi:mRNA export factor GLE1 isoform X1 [Denticeps clupeoides]|uniref:mRNA export factor GLE1 n=2 Tax=Denticeps clupeoides TaxID=299321 RepID=A0AAY4DX93_9TELE|nr:nucleoporin GLE1 isoform X1 [Denticeps clupeoides]
MAVESLRFQTIEALKNSSKGQLKYYKDWAEKGEDPLAGCNVSPSLSPQSEIILKRLSSRVSRQNLSLPSPTRDASPAQSEASLGFHAVPQSLESPASPCTPPPPSSSTGNDTSKEDDKNNAPEPNVDFSPVPASSPPPTISLLSPKATQMAGFIRMCEENQRAQAKAQLNLRQELQVRMMAAVASRESEQLKRYEELMELKQRQEHQSMMDMIEKETQESLGRQEKLKEEQQKRIKILNLRMREAEQQRLREAELERQRQADGRERLRTLNAIQEEVLQLNQLLEPATSTQTAPTTDHASYITRGNQLCSQVSEVVRATVGGDFPSMEDMSVVERALQEMRSLVRALQEEKAQAEERRKKEQMEEEERRKQAEMQAQQEAQKKSAALSKAKAKKQGLQTNADDCTMKFYKDLQDASNQCAQFIEDINNTKDMQTKKLRMELQKAATIPVSQISSTSGSKLREVFDKLDKLLSGRPLVSGGRSISVSQHPQALNYVSYKLAEKFVKQGEEEVASHHEAAFPIAVVASGIWELHPKVGELFLAHLHKKCPYSVPYYPAMKEGTLLEDYQRKLGYRVDAAGVEAQDSFLKRMSGMIRLYAAIIQLRWPHGNKQVPHPHSLNHAWRWLAQMLNMEPLAEVTATLLFDFLEVCGYALMNQYQGQFWKLLFLLKEDYFPRIEAITSTDQMGAVIRLKQFLEDSLRSKRILPPKGHLDPGFWRS